MLCLKQVKKNAGKVFCTFLYIYNGLKEEYTQKTKSKKERHFLDQCCAVFNSESQKHWRGGRLKKTDKKIASCLEPVDGVATAELGAFT